MAKKDLFNNDIKQEMYLDSEKIDYVDENKKDFEALLLLLVGLIQAGRPMKKIRRVISSKIDNKNIEKEFLKYVEGQSKVVLRNSKTKKVDFDINKDAVDGFSFKQSLKDRKRANVTRAVRFADRLKKQARLSKNYVYTEVRKEVKKQVNSEVSFWRTNAKLAREESYTVRDKETEGLTGWLSVAILDNRTSPICVELSDKFYEVTDYKDRGDIPNPPPRHYNCRSILTPVYDKYKIEEYKKEDVDTFFRKNPDAAKEFLGERKRAIWLKSGEKIRSFIDVKGERLFTNEEIMKKLKK